MSNDLSGLLARARADIAALWRTRPHTHAARMAVHACVRVIRHLSAGSGRRHGHRGAK